MRGEKHIHRRDAPLSGANAGRRENRQATNTKRIWDSRGCGRLLFGEAFLAVRVPAHDPVKARQARQASPQKKRKQASALEGRLAGDGGLHFFFVDVEVGVNVLDVVVIFESFHHAHHLLRLLAAQFHIILGNEADFGG